MKALLKSFWKDESGQALAEYGLVLALVAVATIAVVVSFRAQLQALWTSITTGLSGAAPASGAGS